MFLQKQKRGFKHDVDFAAELKDIEPPPAHPPCSLSSLKMKQFNDKSQRTIASMFGPKQTKSKSTADEGYVSFVLCL